MNQDKRLKEKYKRANKHRKTEIKPKEYDYGFMDGKYGKPFNRQYIKNKNYKKGYKRGLLARGKI